MTSPDKLALASRVEQAGGPDRGLDAEIWWIARQHEETDAVVRGQIRRNGITKALDNIWRGWRDRHTVPHYTASLDAITALIAEKLPDACIGSSKTPAFARGQREEKCPWEAALILNEREEQPGHGEPPEWNYDSFYGHAATEPLARVAAFLRALTSTEDHP